MFSINAGEEARRFREFYESVFPLLMRISYRITGSQEAAEDLCQDAFIRFHEKAIAFKSSDEAKYWMIRVLKNGSLNYAKRKGRERRAYEKATRNIQDVPVVTGESELLRSETEREVKEALEFLPEKFKTVLVLKEYGDMNYKEIAGVLGITEGNVKVRVFRAREMLSRFLKEERRDVP